MAFPPEFSSTLKYANRYDLDEIDVFIQGEANNPMYFSLSGLPNQLSFGKHYFYLSILDSKNKDYQLTYGSRILFEFKSKNNVVLKSDTTTLEQQNGIITCFVEILNDPLTSYSDIYDGVGTLTVVGSLENKSTTQNLIPEKFIGAMNYRCTFPIDIRKNLVNANSPTVLQFEHILETALGRFSFAKASISTPANSQVGLEFGTAGAPANQPLTKKGGS